jgi:MoxR-like ATPase
MPRLADFGLRPVSDERMLAALRQVVAEIRVSNELISYIVDLIRATREHSSLEVGASTRAANMLTAATRAFAALQGRDFVIPDDVKMLFFPVLRHRVVVSPGGEIDGLTADKILQSILEQVSAPR